MNLNGWKLFYSGADIITRAHADVDALVEPNLACKITDCKAYQRKVYAPNLRGDYETFLEEVQCALSEAPNTEFLTLMGDFNAHVGVEAEKWNGVNRKNGTSDINNNGMKLLRFSANNRLSIMNTFYEHRKVHPYTWFREACAQKSMIDLIIVSSELDAQSSWWTREVQLAAKEKKAAFKKWLGNKEPSTRVLYVEARKLAREYFDGLLNHAQQQEDSPVEQNGTDITISVDEIAQAVKSFRNGKGAGIDEIRPEMLKAVGEQACAG
ncbi:unnamed protein product [Soboliphyme baturini]|uniref:Endo/exonuclease/phosphatase domain-containing protein n=1 Tax=Soboliphyme baturini TaxID=241478 RepID=A0A183J1C0_9BILA|nr:unnamed protein product [Soboliphyme baturini]